MDAVTQSSPTKEDYLPVCTAKYLGSSDEEEYNLGPAKDSSGEEVLPQPTEEEEKELRRIVAYPPWYIYLLCFIEFAERASYYGTGDRLNNFYQNPLPPNGNGAGAPAPGSLDSPGGLGKGLQVANSLYQLLRFTSYFFPLITGYVSDVYLGPMQMLWTGVWTGIFSHVVFVLAALPPVLKHTNASMVISLIGLLSLSVCTAFVKPVLLPLLLHQYPHKYNVVKTLKTGERVILDRDASLQRMTMSFYWAINVGAFVSVGTSYSAKDIGYWLAFLIPLVIYLMMPPVLLFLQHRMVVQPPSGSSVFSDVLKVIKVCFEAGWIKRYRQGTFWEYAKPTNLRLQGRVGWRKKKPGFYKEGMVSDTKLVLSACTIFLYYIIYNMNDSQLNPAINNQTISMTAKGVPNDVIGNFNALSIIIFMPLLDYGVYPLLRRTRITFKPVHRIFVGFMVGVASSVAGAVIQWRIYETSPCGNHASDCVKNGGGVSPLSLWLVGIEYVLQGVSECLAMTTGYEIAFERSPKEMKSFVMALFLSTIAASAILAEVINPIMSDPYLIVPFAMFAALGTLFALLFLYRYRNLDDEMEAEKLQRQLPELIERTSH